MPTVPKQNTTGGSGGGGAIPSTIAGGLDGSVLFIHPANTLAQDNNNFYFNVTAPTASATSQLSVNTGGDFGGTDAVNIYGQYDAYNPNSVVNGGSGQAANLLLDGIVPGVSLSSSRGTGLVPVNLNTGDFIGGVFGYGYTASAYANIGSTVYVARGATAANLGGEIQWWTKADAGVLTQRSTLNNLGFLGLGQLTPTGQFHIGGAVSSAAWTTAGIGIKTDAAIFTDTTSSGTIAAEHIHVIAIPTLAASSATTVTNAATLVVQPVAAGTNVTIGTPWAAAFAGRTSVSISGTSAFVVGTGMFSGTAFIVDTTNGRISVGLNAVPTGKVHIGGASSAASWTTAGIGLRSDAATYTDTSTAGSGTVALAAVHAFALPSINSTNVTVTYTNAATLYIANGPAGTGNVTVTNRYALYSAAGRNFFGGSIDSASAQTSVGGSTSGTANFSMPEQGSSRKSVLVYCSALLGTASYTFPTAFTQTPQITTTNGPASGVVTALSTTAITITGATTTGFVELVGY